MSASLDGRSIPLADRPLTRRGLLTMIGTGAVLSTQDVKRTSVSEEPVSIRVYPGSLPPLAWTWYRLTGTDTEWAPPFEASLEAIREAFEQVAAHAKRTEDVDLNVVVERGAPVDIPVTSRSSIREAVSPTQQGLLDAFRDVLSEREVLLNGRSSHLLLWWGPFDYAVGYGGTRRPNRHVDAVDGEGAQVVANVGATEWWDSRAITRNIAIHEALHTFLAPSVVEQIVDSRCDHDLGSSVRVDEKTREVSPMATAYAGPDQVGEDTRFHGTACYDHDSFFRHDGYEGVEQWKHTTKLTEATLEATTRYVLDRLEYDG